MAGFLATAYGPPWNAMNGSGVTSTGVRLGGQVPVIAVDPSVIPYGSIVRVSNSPLGPNKLFVAADTGGGIKGNHIDFYVASGRPAQMGWGAKQIQLQMVRPGSGPGSVHSALQQVTGGQGGGGGAAGPTLGLTNPSSTNFSVPVFSQSFDQAGYKQAQGRYIAGAALKATDSPSNPFSQVPGASKGFAKSLGPDSGALFTRGLLSSSAPNPQNFVTQRNTMQQIAIHGLQQLTGSGLVNTHAGAQGYVNPIPGAVVGRTDMGVDASLRPGAPIRAIGDSKVLGILPGWYQGQPYLALQLTSGPRAGQVYYVAEQIQPRVRPGQTVRAGQPIATFAPQGTGIEIGWASPHNWQQTLAQASGNTGDSSHGNAPAGVNFRSFLGQLGA